MKTFSKIACLLLGTLVLGACQNRSKKPDYAVQVSLGGWEEASWRLEKIVTRIGSVDDVIPVGKVIVGWTPDKETYRQLGLLCCWKRVFAMTSAFSWHNSVSLCPASFCTPRCLLIQT